MSGALVPVRRSRRKPAQVGGVVNDRPVGRAEAIVREVQERGRRQEAEISRLLQEAVQAANQRHRERAAVCSTLGGFMDRPMLDDWIEIGERMLAAKGGRI